MYRIRTNRVRVYDAYGKRHTILDLTGEKYGRLLVLKFVTTDGHGRAIFLCKCECGKRTEVTGGDLRTKKNSTVSCGCYSRDLTRRRNHAHRETKHYRFRDLTGIKQNEGRLTALKIIDFDEDFRHARWSCLCDPELGGCGNVVVIRRGAFLDETTKSCGCWKQEVDASRIDAANPNFRHGRCIGDFDRKAYESWLRSIKPDMLGAQ